MESPRVGPGRSAAPEHLAVPRWGCAVLASLVCAACVSYEPDPLVPADELALLSERGALDVSVELEPSVSAATEWFPLQRDVAFGDGLSLAEANALALFNAPRILAARTEARVAGAQVLQAGLFANPELFLGPRLTADASDLIFPASLGWKLPIWGEEGAERGQAEARAAERRWYVVGVELAALRDVRLGFLDIAARRQVVAIRDQLVTETERLATWVARLHASGGADAVTTHLARLEYDDALAAAEDARLDLARLRTGLLELIGLLPTAPVEIEVGTAALPAVPPADEQRLLRHPALRQREAAYRAAESALRLEVAKQYPSVTFGPEFESDDGQASWGIGLGLELPLFDRNRGGIAAAEEVRDAAREAYRHRVLELSHREALARVELESAERQLASYRAGTQTAVEAMRRAISARLSSGLASATDVIAAQTATTRARVRVVELERRAAAARVAVAVAAGSVIESKQTEEDR